jgi:hypothetical protein
MNRLAMRLIDLPLPSRYVRKVLYTGEYYPFWDYHCRGFGDPCRDLCKEDVTNKAKVVVREVMGKMLSSKRDRLLIKITGWPRISFLKEIFPDAKFIHVYRDGRAVASSWLQVWWWAGWKGPENWRRGKLTPEQEQKWQQSGKSFVVLAAMEWEILMAAYDKAKREVPTNDFMEIRYEDLCQNPKQFFRTAMEFGNLEWSTRIEATLNRIPLESANDKWRRDLNEAQQRMLCEYLADSLQRYGYKT